ncbi:DUF418 domain-containing protein [Nonomuraea roseoviolacea]|uniref:DUF418 domain-containing protein n=1 Tax=Nonomuraea roseoviolacea subsp. carminata TaxID=160689 RepID=A0ABT1KEY6_9ACTN|nr:DUF418 domain-containing protein [Nonomuraea roseoviolacea]MCP2352147.1 uncharacterized protein [Nonomuraea roseoviolacea subsp. carminata]
MTQPSTPSAAAAGRGHENAPAGRGHENAPPGRVHEVDAVRGFALAGILVANIGFLADPGYALTGVMPIPDGPVAYTIVALVLTKFYVIFSFLFGYSFTLQMRAAERAGASVRARTLRRCLGLFLIGVAHGFLLWVGDILTLYALLGVALLALRGLRPRTAVITGAAIIGTLTLVMAALAALSALGPSPAPAATADPAEAARVLALATGGPLDFLRMQAGLYPPMALMVWVFQGPTALAMFLFGLAAGKSRLLEGLGARTRLLRRVQWIGFGAGLPGGVLYAWSTPRGGVAEVAGLAVNTVTSLLLAAAYVATLVRVIGRFPAVGRALAPAGRMAASNYLGQSLLVALVFTGYGLALGGRLAPIAVMGVAAAIYAVLLTLSAWWLRSHRQGPVEYGLRRLTNGPARS